MNFKQKSGKTTPGDKVGELYQTLNGNANFCRLVPINKGNNKKQQNQMQTHL